jgi:hypothetical protein
MLQFGNDYHSELKRIILRVAVKIREKILRSRSPMANRGVKKDPIFVPYLQHRSEKPSREAAAGAFGVARRCGLDMVVSADGGRLLFVLA